MASPFQPVLNGVHVAVNFTTIGGVAQNNLYFQGETDMNPVDDFPLLADVISGAWVIFLQDFVSDDVTLNTLVVTDIRTSLGISLVVPVGSAGTNLAAQSPTNVTVTTKFNTTGRGRSFRGRNYFVGMCDSEVTGNTVDANLLDALIAYYENIRLEALLVGLGYNHIIVQRWSSGTYLLSGVPHPVVSYTHVDNYVDSQRRRLTGRGA